MLPETGTPTDVSVFFANKCTQGHWPEQPPGSRRPRFTFFLHHPWPHLLLEGWFIHGVKLIVLQPSQWQHFTRMVSSTELPLKGRAWSPALKGVTQDVVPHPSRWFEPPSTSLCSVFLTVCWGSCLYPDSGQRTSELSRALGSSPGTAEADRMVRTRSVYLGSPDRPPSSVHKEWTVAIQLHSQHALCKIGAQ